MLQQNENALRYCEQNGLILDQTLVDIGKSGGGIHKVKGVLGQFFNMVETGKIVKGSILLIDEFSRLSREEVPKALEDFLRLINNDIIVISLEADADGNLAPREYQKDNLDLANLLTSIIMMSRAYEERSYKKTKARANWRELRKRAEKALKQKTAELQLNCELRQVKFKDQDMIDLPPGG